MGAGSVSGAGVASDNARNRCLPVTGPRLPIGRGPVIPGGRREDNFQHDFQRVFAVTRWDSADGDNVSRTRKQSALVIAYQPIANEDSRRLLWRYTSCSEHLSDRGASRKVAAHPVGPERRPYCREPDPLFRRPDGLKTIERLTLEGFGR
jgi:hypothetical protein